MTSVIGVNPTVTMTGPADVVVVAKRGVLTVNAVNPHVALGNATQTVEVQPT